MACEFCILALAFFLAFESDDTCARWTSDARNRCRSAGEVFFLLPSRALRLVDDQSVMKLFDGFELNLAHAVLAFRRSRNAGQSK